MHKLFVAIIVALIAIMIVPMSASADFHFGLGYQIEDKEFTVESENNLGFTYESVAVFNSPIESGRIDFGFDITKNLGMEFSLYRSAESTIYSQSFYGAMTPIGLPIGIPYDESPYFSISSFGWRDNPVLVSGNLSGATKVKYRTSGGSTEFVYNFPSSWPKKDVVRFKGFLGYMKSNGIMTTDFEVKGSGSASGGDIIIVGAYDKTTTKNESHPYTVEVEDVIVGYDPSTQTQKYYKKTPFAFGGGYGIGLFKEVALTDILKQEFVDKLYSGEISDEDIYIVSDSGISIIVPMDPTGISGSQNTSIRQEQEVEGTYLGLSMTYDVIKNLDMELACRHVVYGSVENTVSGPGFSSSLEDDRPDITMVDLIFTAHFVKGVDLKAIYSKTFARYELSGADFDEETGKISLVLDYRF